MSKKTCKQFLVLLLYLVILTKAAYLRQKRCYYGFMCGCLHFSDGCFQCPCQRESLTESNGGESDGSGIGDTTTPSSDGSGNYATSFSANLNSDLRGKNQECPPYGTCLPWQIIHDSNGCPKCSSGQISNFVPGGLGNGGQTQAGKMECVHYYPNCPYQCRNLDYNTGCVTCTCGGNPRPQPTLSKELLIFPTTKSLLQVSTSKPTTSVPILHELSSTTNVLPTYTQTSDSRTKDSTLPSSTSPSKSEPQTTSIKIPDTDEISTTLQTLPKKTHLTASMMSVMSTGSVGNATATPNVTSRSPPTASPTSDRWTHSTQHSPLRTTMASTTPVDDPNALHCKTCTNITDISKCAIVFPCQSNEYCLIQKFTMPSGITAYNLGCATIQKCQAIDEVVVPGTLICQDCCDSNICNIKSCSQPHSLKK